MANKKTKSKADSPAIAELDLLERIKQLEKQQMRMIKEINASVARITKACEKLLTQKPATKPKQTKPVRERYADIIKRGKQE